MLRWRVRGAAPEGHAVTRDHARKKAIRARMDASGETYSTAARKLDAAGAGGGPAAPGAVLIARVNSTLASPGARIAMRADWGSRWGLGRPAGYRPGRVERLATLAAKAVVKRISPETDLASVREKLAGALFHPAGEGFIEPAADRCQVDFRGIAVMRFNGQDYRGAPGAPLEDKHRWEGFPDAPLELLRRLRDVTNARPVGRETVRGTPCQVIAARVGSAEYTVWVDEEHVRRVSTEQGGSSERVDLSLTKAFELWDFGTGDIPADWTRLPDFRTDRESTVTR
jgi:hypothetical protein